MADKVVVRRALLSIANMHNKHPEWVNDCVHMWTEQLEHKTNDDVTRGVKDLLRKSKSGRIPTVANLLEVIEASPLASERHEVYGCTACGGTGQRSLVRWWQMQGTQKVVEYVAACDCAKGRALAMGAFRPWRDVVNAWNQNEWTDAVYYGTSEQPTVPLQYRVHPDVYARIRSPEHDQK